MSFATLYAQFLIFNNPHPATSAPAPKMTMSIEKPNCDPPRDIRTSNPITIAVIPSINCKRARVLTSGELSDLVIDCDVIGFSSSKTPSIGFFWINSILLKILFDKIAFSIYS